MSCLEFWLLVSCIIYFTSISPHTSTVQHSPQPCVPVSGMHINCGNEGHSEEQLESFSVSTTLLVGKLLPGVNLTKTRKTPYVPSTTSHFSQRCCWEIRSQGPEPCRYVRHYKIHCQHEKQIALSETGDLQLWVERKQIFWKGWRTKCPWCCCRTEWGGI